jgi:hypothetical protein
VRTPLAVLFLCAFCALCASALGGCDDDRRRAPAPGDVPPAPAAPVASVARVLGVDAAELEPTVDPPAPAGDLKAELDAFTTVDACVTSHARVDPLVGDALEAIGYDTFLRDACRMLDAAKARDAKRCEAIDASSLRGRCEATVAQIAGTPDACPWELPTRRALGRDAACVAIAARDPRLCAGEGDSAARATCEATLRHDTAPCKNLPLRADQARCARDAERWRTATPAVDTKSEPLPAPAGRLRVEGGDAGAPIEADLAVDLAHGVVLVEQRDGVRLVVGPLTESGVGFVAPSPQHRASLALELFVMGGGGSSAHGAHAHAGEGTAKEGAPPARIERAELLLPGHLALATPASSSTLVAKVNELERARGGAVSFTVDGTIGSAEATWRVHAEATTFVRDVVTAAALHDVAAPGGDAWTHAADLLGLDAGMR